MYTSRQRCELIREKKPINFYSQTMIKQTLIYLHLTVDPRNINDEFNALFWGKLELLLRVIVQVFNIEC